LRQLIDVDCAKGERNAWQTTASDCDLSVAFSAGPILAEELERILDGVRAFKLGYSEVSGMT